MGKSPGRWIKTVLFGKKSSKSHSTKRSGNEKLVNAKGLEDDAISAPIISHPIPVPTIRSERHLEVESRETTDLQNNEVVSLPANQDVVPQVELSDDERRRQEEAATLAQAAFRGYLARRAFKALKGIIRLQALIRGHLVRRQAVATLSCVLGVVKLQALARGVKARSSIVGLDIQRIGSVKPLEGKLGDSNGVHVSILRARLSANTFVRKLVASSPTVMPLSLYCEPEEPNSVQNWLERWTASRFWKPIPQPKKVPHPKTQRKHGNGLEAETGRPKRSVRRVPAANIDNNSLQPASEYEKPKRNFRKVSSHPVETAQENPQSELEKVKRNLKKVHNPVTECSVQPDVEIEKPKHSFEKVSAASGDNHLVHCVNNSGEKMKKETPKLPDVVKDEPVPDVSKSPDAQTTMETLLLHEAVEVDADQVVAEPKPPTENGGDDENISFSNGDLNHNEDPTSYENHEEPTSNGNHKSNRKASREAKQERAENGLHSNSPSIPSYMAATESAKAKLRAQGFPRFSQDSAEKNHSGRRHSLPTSANSKISSQSPRTRPINSGGKSGNKAREGNAKATQVEWRR